MDPAERRTEADRRSDARDAAAASASTERRTEAQRRTEAREAESAAEADEEDGPPAPRRAPSIVLVNTGHGKGKSSAAFGVMGRAWARGWRVGVVQFVKSGKWKTGERKLADHLGIEWHTLGDGFTWESTDLDETAAKGRHAWEVARDKLASGHYDLLVLDELTYAVKYGWVPVADVVQGVGDRAPRTNVVITGRDAPEELIEVADTVTEMRKVKHAYDRGITAKKGIEY
jgi:cob(I)alamin adenosyltransferase